MFPSLEIVSTCIHCDNCKQICPEKAITIEDDYIIDNFSCTLCNLCIAVCPEDSIKIKKEK
jgi:pyruvate formate lyase activating enzyme